MIKDQYASVANSVHLSLNAQRVLKSRYLRENEEGKLESPEEMFQRVAHKVAQAELVWGTWSDSQFWEERFFEIMCDLKFLPNSPTLMNAGTTSSQLSACFVLPVEDSLNEIFSTLRLAALIQQSGGGTGFNFSRLRAKNSPLDNTQGSSSGPVSFMKVFDAATEHVKQGGKRRGANMGILNVDHPDIEEFITSKSENKNLHNFNISVGVSDAFMKAVQQDSSWELKHPNTGVVAKKIKARKVWTSIVNSAWENGDPGLVFLDTINKANPTPTLGNIESTNPCGEVPLLPYESCNLGSLNLSKYVVTRQKNFDWQALGLDIDTAVRFLDNVIEVNQYHSPEIKDIAFGNRKIGLGVMGWAEGLSQLEIPYDSNEAVQLAEKLMNFLSDKSKEASEKLVKERGTFNNWNRSTYYPHTPIRNATRTSIAPTGSISIIADTSPSIEPFFALAYQRHHVLKDETLEAVNKNLLNYLNVHHIPPDEVIKTITDSGTLKDVTCLSEGEKSVFKTALEIKPEWHLRHQAAFQKFTDNAVSKTINLPQEATPTDVSSIYEQAWQLKLKGITIYRYGSKPKQVMYQGIVSEIKNCKVCIE